MNRRHFLKDFTGAAVGAGVMAYAPIVAPFAPEITLDEVCSILMTQMNEDIREGLLWGGTNDVHLNEKGAMIVRQYFYGYTDRPWRVLPK